MSSEEHFNFREIVSLNIKALHIFGYFRPDTDSKLQRMLYEIYSIFAVGLLLFVLTLSEVANMYVIFGDFEQMIADSFLSMSHWIHYVKLYVLRGRGDVIWKLIHDIERREYLPKSPTQLRILETNVRNSKIIFKTFFSMCIMCGICFTLIPFLGAGPGDVGKKKLPYGGWYPESYFVASYIYQIFASPLTGLGNISIDTFITSMIMVASSQLEMLNDSVKNLKQFAMEKAAKNGRNLEEEMNLCLIECVKQHQYILDYTKTLNKVFTECIFGQFLFSVIIICFTLFKIALVPITDVQFLTLILYLMCMLLEIFLWCYYGNEIIIHSNELTNSAYFTHWAGCSKRFGKNLVYFMTRSQLTLKMFAGGFFTLSLQTFVTILRSSWSYFAVLNHMNIVKEEMGPLM